MHLTIHSCWCYDISQDPVGHFEYSRLNENVTDMTEATRDISNRHAYYSALYIVGIFVCITHERHPKTWVVVREC